MAFKNAAKAHGEWDRAKRLFTGTIALALNNARTKDTTMLSELQEIVFNGTKDDEYLSSWETQQRSGENMGKDVINHIKDLCDAIYNYKKDGSVRNTMLMAWIRMKTSEGWL